eukprot:TRINITY_DN7873_c0_g1_i2.p1 TRINITY_DN7873_c0_g1~~TRINITY_DN7873_c0_g1_i2.p1  ORF type:complete len:270 (-),score=68.62 TRINITY_DN7873_c0_g1_i2:43-852(-)
MHASSWRWLRKVLASCPQVLLCVAVRSWAATEPPSEHREVCVIRLPGLSMLLASTLLQGITGARRVSPQAVLAVQSWAQGSPRAIEHVCTAMLAQHLLRVRAGQLLVLASTGALERLMLPEELLSQVHRYDYDERRVLEHASVFGRVVPCSLLTQLCPEGLRSKADAMMHDLEQQGVFTRVRAVERCTACYGVSVLESRVFQFRQLHVCAALYQQMPRGDRLAMHSKLARHYCNPDEQDLPALQQSSPCLLYTSPSPRDRTRSRMPSSA